MPDKRFAARLKEWVPAPLRRLGRRLYNRGQTLVPPQPTYAERYRRELASFIEPAKVDELPAIAHYWSNKHLVPMLQPFGFLSAHECIRSYLERLCHASKSCVFLSIGCGKAEAELDMAAWLSERGIENFEFECLDINKGLLTQARESAAARGMTTRFTFTAFDVNAWIPARRYDAIVALQSLHHVVELEKLLDAAHTALKDHGYFLSDDMIGRNGHQRWPEALKLVNELWTELPDAYKYNHQLRRFEDPYENWDCSAGGFEGIRAQDILPLLLQHLHFEFFFAFGNVIDVFIDRGFGHNFNPDREWDRAFIDRVHATDVDNLERGVIKPTHMIAAMRKVPSRLQVYKHFTPEFCVRQVQHSRLKQIWR